jgi:hypothetical protein
VQFSLDRQLGCWEEQQARISDGGVKVGLECDGEEGENPRLVERKRGLERLSAR